MNDTNCRRTGGSVGAIRSGSRREPLPPQVSRRLTTIYIGFCTYNHVISWYHLLMQGLSHRENQVYNLICQHWSKKTCAPPMRWIAKELHLKSKGYIHKIIHSLIDKGYLTMVPGKPRTIRPL